MKYLFLTSLILASCAKLGPIAKGVLDVVDEVCVNTDEVDLCISKMAQHQAAKRAAASASSAPSAVTAPVAPSASVSEKK